MTLFLRLFAAIAALRPRRRRSRLPLPPPVAGMLARRTGGGTLGRAGRLLTLAAPAALAFAYLLRRRSRMADEAPAHPATGPSVTTGGNGALEGAGTSGEGAHETEAPADRAP